MEHINYKLTQISCFVGIFVQAICCNITAILFIPMMDLYGFTYVDLGILVAINFTAQVAVDILFSGSIDKLGYRKMALPTILCGFVGLVLFAASPFIFPNHIFLGIVLSTIIFAASSGLLEVLISPISSAIPSEDMGSSMALVHSFYAWGQVATIVITTLFLFVFPHKYWQVIVLFWALVPLINFFMFLRSPFPPIIAHEHRQSMKSLFFKPFYLVALAAIFFGAGTEIVISQFASTFMEKALSMPKVWGDLLGMCGFAVMLGVGRLIYGIHGAKLNISNVLISGSVLATVCYTVVALSPYNSINIIACAVSGLAASLLWPGTLVIASEHFPMAGAWIFAILAAAGDIGGAFGPYVTGLIVDSSIGGSLAAGFATLYNTTAEQAAIRIGILTATIFPLLAIICHILMKRMNKRDRENG